VVWIGELGQDAQHHGMTVTFVEASAAGPQSSVSPGLPLFAFGCALLVEGLRRLFLRLSLSIHALAHGILPAAVVSVVRV